jgi:hypothetical protein
MEQMANTTGIPLDLIKRVKKAGCNFIRHGRCDLGIWLKFYFETELSSDELEDWSRRDKRAAALIREIQLARAELSVIDSAEVNQFILQLVRDCFFGELERLRAEFPSLLKGRTEVAIASECDQQIANIKLALEKWFRVWSKKIEKPLKLETKNG